MSYPALPVDPHHSYSQTTHLPFTFYSQTSSPASFGYEYYLSLPPSYVSSATSTKQWPLILFLHGAGESQRGPWESYGSLRHGVPKVVLCYDKMKGGMKPAKVDIPRPPRYRNASGLADRSVEPVEEEACRLCAEEFITIMPSLNMEIYKIVEKKAGRKLPEFRKNYFGYGWNTSVLSALLDQIVHSYRIDLDRIHVTGFSMGGYGTWALALHSPQRFASLIPICGGGDAARVSLISHVPQWIHHGELDDVVPIKQSQDMYAALQKAGAVDVEFTQYPDLKHDSWTDAYANPDLYRWMLRQRRKGTGDERVVPEENLAVVGEREQ